MKKEVIGKIAVALAAGQDRIVKPHEASVITGRSLASMWRDGKEGRFPQKYKTGIKSTGYLYSELMAWMDALQAVTPETTQPVATPADGKRRGRLSTAEKNARNAATALIEDVSGNPNVLKFTKRMRNIGIIPPKEIQAEGKLHVIDGSAENGYFILDLDSPAAGLFGWWDGEDKMNYVYPREAERMELSDQDKAAVKAKLGAMRKLRDNILTGASKPRK
jgi:predicted DNA-binding transcriptional regulator AlpA